MLRIEISGVVGAMLLLALLFWLLTRTPPPKAASRVQPEIMKLRAA